MIHYCLLLLKLHSLYIYIFFFSPFINHLECNFQILLCQTTCCYSRPQSSFLSALFSLQRLIFGSQSLLKLRLNHQFASGNFPFSYIYFQSQSSYASHLFGLVVCNVLSLLLIFSEYKPVLTINNE